MKRLTGLAVLVGGWLLAAPVVQAVSVGLEPSELTVSVGDTLDVQVQVSGLGDMVAPSLGGFDISISFDAGVLDFEGFVFGDPVVGDQLDVFGLGSDGQVTGPVGGVVSLFELSFDFPSDLVDLQAGDFGLGVLTFRAIGAGISPLHFTAVYLADENGDPLADVSVVGGRVRVEGAAGLPEPGTLFLVGPVAFGLAGLRTRRGRAVGGRSRGA